MKNVLVLSSSPRKGGNKELISEKAAFVTPVSPTPLIGAEGYMSVVSMTRARS